MSLGNLLQNPDHSQRKQALAHVNKWEKTGLLEGLRSETEKAGMSQLLENQARQLVKEASQTGTANGSEEWAGVALPLVRRIFAEFAAKEFVSVQPMNLPSGLVFYLDFKYGTAQPGFTADQTDPVASSEHPFAANESADSMFGVTNTSNDPSGGLYGRGKSTYSSKMTQSLLTAANICTNGTATCKDVLRYIDNDMYEPDINEICSIEKPLSIRKPNSAVPKAVAKTIKAVVKAFIEPIYLTP